MKRRRLSGLAGLFLAACIFFAEAVFAADFSLPAPTDAFYVNDGAGLIGAESESYIVASDEELYRKTGAQAVVVTVQSLNGAALEEYATELFRYYGIGSAEKNNGVLILLALEDRECRIEVGYGLEGAINDAKAGRIMDNYMIPFFKEEKWEEGLLNGFNAVLDEICKEYGTEITHNAAAVPAGSGETEEDDDYNEWRMLLAGGVGLIVGLIFGAVFPNKAAIPGIGFLVIDLLVLLDKFSTWSAILTFILTVVAYIIGWAITSPPVAGGGSGGSGSGSGSSRSYSSYSSGGGSHHSGGGGRSGGGGASRKF